MRKLLLPFVLLAVLPSCVFAQTGLYDDLRRNDLSELKAKVEALGGDFKGTPIISWYLENAKEVEPEVFRFLLEHGADINLPGPDGLAPIWIVLNESISAFELVLQAKPKLDISLSGRIPFRSDYASSVADFFGFLPSGDSIKYPLVLGAVDANSYYIVDRLVKAGMPINATVSQTLTDSKTKKKVITTSLRNPIEWGIMNNLWAGISPVLRSPSYKGQISSEFQTIGYFIAAQDIARLKRALLNYSEDTRDLGKIAIDSQNEAALSLLLAYNSKDTSVSFEGVVYGIGSRISPFEYSICSGNTAFAKKLVPLAVEDIKSRLNTTELQLHIDAERNAVILGGLRITPFLSARILGDANAPQESATWQGLLVNDYHPLANALSLIMGLEPLYYGRIDAQGNVTWSINPDGNGFRVPEQDDSEDFDNG